MVVEENPAETTSAPATPAQAETAPAATATVAAGTLTAAEVDAIVKREVEPIKRMLAELHDSGPTMADIFGGIGWIFGLFGVAAYMQSRRRP